MILKRGSTLRKKRLLWNTASSFGNQIITIICGFVLPRVILQAYGSGINGLVSSITQFLGIIAFLEFGVGAVVQSSLYQPLAEKNHYQTSAIVCSSNRFFRKIATIMLIYIIGLCFFYPVLISDYDVISTIILIIVMSISLFAQYYFGITNQLLLVADQKGYIVYLLQASTVLINTIVCTVLIYAGVSIQVVKLVTSAIYLFRPIGQYLYVYRNYKINRSIVYESEPIQQKWNGLAQHIAAVVLDNTDTIVLTCLSTLENVSIYSVYYIVVKGVKQLFLSMTHGVQALLGELWAKKEIKELKKTFDWTEWVIHTGTTFVFGVTTVLIVPFVRVYTLGINDADYIQPLFAVLIVAANAAHCLRLPYNIMILAAGHYKQTQNNYIVAAVINIVVSVLAVNAWGLIGVAIGTLLAMGYQTVWMAWYDSKNLINWPIFNFFKHILIDVGTLILCWMASAVFTMNSVSYFGWVINAVEVGVVWLIIMTVVNLVFYRDKMLRLINALKWKLVK